MLCLCAADGGWGQPQGPPVLQAARLGRAGLRQDRGQGRGWHGFPMVWESYVARLSVCGLQLHALRLPWAAQHCASFVSVAASTPLPLLQYTSRAAQLYRQQLEKEAAKYR